MNTQNVSFKVGETWVIDATLHDSDCNPLDLNGATVRWRIAFDGIVIYEASLNNGIAIVGDGTTGQCKITVTPAQQMTLNIKPAFYQQECQAVLVDGTVTDQFSGFLNAKPSLFS